VTADYQQVTVQGQVTYRVADPKRTAALLNFAAIPAANTSRDPGKLSQRLIDAVQVAMRSELQTLPMKAAADRRRELRHPDRRLLKTGRRSRPWGLKCWASRSSPSSRNRDGQALEAEAREALLRRADEAIYARRNSAVEQERAIKENELSTRSRSRTRSARSRSADEPTARCASAAADRAGGDDRQDRYRGTPQQLVDLARNTKAESDAKAMASHP